MKKTFLLIAAISLFFFSCAKNHKPAASEGSVELNSSEEIDSDLSEPTQLYHEGDGKVCILFGYGYNDKDFVEETEKRLYEKYGNSQNGGRIIALVFPDDFKRGSKTYITNLTGYVEDQNMSGILLLGAPENTHTAIARLQDQHDGYLPYPVFSLFSQDDILGMEDSADFVLDKVQKAEINGMVAESEQSTVAEINELIDSSVKYLIMSDSGFEKNARLMDFVKMITGKMKIQRYCDTESNLISINHFVLE